jgi:hypothetical protein
MIAPITVQAYKECKRFEFMGKDPVRLVRVTLNPWLILIHENETHISSLSNHNGTVGGWGMTVPGCAIYSGLQDGVAHIYNGHEYLVPIPPPPNDLMFKTDEYIQSWIKMMLVFA